MLPSDPSTDADGHESAAHEPAAAPRPEPHEGAVGADPSDRHEEADESEFQDTVELVQRAQGGDVVATEAVLARYYPRVLGIVRSRLGRRLRQHIESDDLVQETMIAVVRDFDAFEMKSDSALIRWISHLVENRIRDSARFYEAKRRTPDGIEVALDTRNSSTDRPGGATVVDEAPIPSERVERDEDKQRVAAGLARLEPRHREVIERHNAKETWASIGSAMGLPSGGAARSLYARAKLALMRELEGPQA